MQCYAGRTGMSPWLAIYCRTECYLHVYWAIYICRYVYFVMCLLSIVARNVVHTFITVRVAGAGSMKRKIFFIFLKSGR